MRRIPVSTAVIVLGMCVFWVMLASRLLPIAQRHDFLDLYTGGRLALEGRFAELHSAAVQFAEQRRIVPDLAEVVPFMRPVFYALALAPIGALPYHAAFLVWLALQSALLIGCWIWAWRRFGPDALVYSALFLPAPLGIAAGQDCVIMLALLIIAFEIDQRGHAFASGCVLALMLFKFHLVVLWPVAMLIQKRWRMFAGFCAVGAGEVLLSLALGGMAEARLYVAMLGDKTLDRAFISEPLMVSYQGFLANLGIESMWVAALMIAGILVLFLRAIVNGPIFVIAPLASLLVVPHVYAYDTALLLAPILFTIFQSKNKAARIGAALLATPIPFGFALADKPWAIVASASLMVFFIIIAADAHSFMLLKKMAANEHE